MIANRLSLFFEERHAFVPVEMAAVYARTPRDPRDIEYTCATRLFYCAVSTKTAIQAIQLEPPEEYSAQIRLIERIGNVTAWLFALTDFGDLAVLIPLAVAVPVWLLLYLSHAAPRWVLALGSCVGLTALLKVVFLWVSAYLVHAQSKRSHEPQHPNLWRTYIGGRDRLARAAPPVGDRRRFRTHFGNWGFTSPTQCS
jgi:hypothetical protein